MLRAATVSALLVMASPAAAQPLSTATLEESTSTASEPDPIAEADSLASTAVALYATGAVLRLGGAGVAAVGALGGFSCALGHGLDCDGWFVSALVGAVASTVGLVVVFVGVDADVR